MSFPSVFPIAENGIDLADEIRARWDTIEDNAIVQRIRKPFQPSVTK